MFALSEKALFIIVLMLKKISIFNIKTMMCITSCARVHMHSFLWYTYQESRRPVMGKTILVVDDDEGITEVVQMVLESEGYQVQTSMTGDGLYHVNSIPPDLILLDILLLGGDGREV